VNSDVPEADDATQGWWDATRDHVLSVQGCRACGHRQHPPRSVCTDCGRMDSLELDPSAGVGVVDSWTEVHRAPRPGVEVPYVVARVRLDEGVLLLSQLVGAGAWTIGDRVALDWHDLPDGRALPVFRRS
jgi:uncharacterized protein